MLRERYPDDKLFDEIVAHFPAMDPVLTKIDRYLEDEELFQLIKGDLSKRRPKTLETGRKSTPVEVALHIGGQAAVPIQLCRNGAVCQRQPGVGAVLSGVSEPSAR